MDLQPGFENPTTKQTTLGHHFILYFKLLLLKSPPTVSGETWKYGYLLLKVILK